MLSTSWFHTACPNAYFNVAYIKVKRSSCQCLDHNVCLLFYLFNVPTASWFVNSLFNNVYAYFMPPLLHTLTHSHPHSDTNNGVKQTAALCLLRLLRVNPRLIPIDQHAARIVQLLNDRHFGVVTSACSLLEELAHINSVGFMDCVSIAVLKTVQGEGVMCDRVRE